MSAPKEDIPLQQVIENHRAYEAEHIAAKYRVRNTLRVVIAVVLLGIAQSWKPIELWEYARGSMMTYEVNSPFPIVGEPVYPGGSVRFLVRRRTDFSKLDSTWILWQVADRNGDGRDELEQVDHGRNHLILKRGKEDYLASAKIADWVPPGKYFIAYLADVSERSYHREVPSQTGYFTVSPPPTKK